MTFDIGEYLKILLFIVLFEQGIKWDHIPFRSTKSIKSSKVQDGEILNTSYALF